MNLLANYPSEIQLSDILPKYILTTLTGNSVASYMPDIADVFNHFFEYSNIPKIVKGIDFSSFKSYIKTSEIIIKGQTDLQEIIEDGLSP